MGTLDVSSGLGEGMAEVFGRELEMGGSGSGARLEVGREGMFELAAETDRLTGEIEETIRRYGRAFSYAADPESDGELAAFLLERLRGRRGRLQDRLRAIRREAEEGWFAAEPPCGVCD